MSNIAVNNVQENKKEARYVKFKTFVERPSLWTDLFTCKHGRVIYNLAISVIIYFMVYSIFEDIVEQRQINIGFKIILSSFGEFYYAIIIWAFLFLFILSFYPLFCYWAKFHIKTLKESPKYNQFYNWASAYVLIIFYGIILAFPTYLLLKCNLPPLSSMIILLEEVRFIMKLHSYVRTSAPNILKFKPKNDYPILGTFNSFVYFLFVPTFIYEDEYPRTEKIDWKFVRKCVLEFISVVLLLSFILEKYVRSFKDVCVNTKPISEIFLIVYKYSPFGLMSLALFGHLLLHIWSNLFAELLRFADRRFYKDWWNTKSYLQYYRTWNDIVQDWLYFFVYKEINSIFPEWKNGCKILVFFISALFHEYIIGVSLRIFFPVNFCFFFFGSVIMLYIKKDMGNIFFLSTMGVGFSIHIALYVMEYYASFNYTQVPQSLSEALIPNILKCNYFTMG